MVPDSRLVTLRVGLVSFLRTPILPGFGVSGNYFVFPCLLLLWILPIPSTPSETVSTSDLVKSISLVIVLVSRLFVDVRWSTRRRPVCRLYYLHRRFHHLWLWPLVLVVRECDRFFVHSSSISYPSTVLVGTRNLSNEVVWIRTTSFFLSFHFSKWVSGLKKRIFPVHMVAPRERSGECKQGQKFLLVYVSISLRLYLWVYNCLQLTILSTRYTYFLEQLRTESLLILETVYNTKIESLNKDLLFGW